MKPAGIVPRKDILDNEVSGAMKKIIRNEYQMEIYLVLPVCHQHNAAEVVISNFKAKFLSVIAGTSDGFPPLLWD